MKGSVDALKKDRSVIIALVVYFLVAGVYFWSTTKPIDFYRHWGISRITDNVNVPNMYSPRARKRVTPQLRQLVSTDPTIPRMHGRRPFLIEHAGTPFLFASFDLLHFGSFRIDYLIYRFFSLGVFAAGFILFLRRLGYAWPGVLVACVASTAVFWPFRLDIMFGNVNQIQMGGLCFSLILLATEERRKVVAAGVLLGLLSGWKPNMALVPVLVALDLWIRRRADGARWLFVGFSGAMAVVLILPALLLGPSLSWVDWLQMMRFAHHDPQYARNSFFDMFLGLRNTMLFRVAGLVAVAGVIARVVTTSRGGADLPIAGAAYLRHLSYLSGLALAAFLFTSPLVHAHYALLLVPLLAVLAQPDADGTPYFNRRRALAVAAAVMLAAHPLMYKLKLTRRPFQNPVSYIGCAILGGLAWKLLQRRKNTSENDGKKSVRTLGENVA